MYPRQFDVALLIGLGAASIGCPATIASAEVVPFTCVITPDGDAASVTITNSLNRDASCIVTCTFSTTRGNNTPQITCAKPVPAGKQVEMCQLPLGGDKMVKLTEGHAECTKLP